MSYILDALRKSEAERHRGQAPTLAGQWQPVGGARRPVRPIGLWVTVALLINAAIVAYVFWPAPENVQIAPATATEAPVQSEQEPEPAVSRPGVPESQQATVEPESGGPVQPPASGASSSAEVGFSEPVIITPGRSRSSAQLTPPPPEGRVPHLVELPLSFQKSVPDLTFSSHIFSSNPSASRVIVNHQPLQTGDRLGNLRLEQITEEGVVFSREGQAFRLGVARQWVSPR
ncbi:general secretion pathway protein GspB [Marinobacter oulmenensis]|uniref:General secretion pathway protein B n=1 Tax=Marinobacter oulmenensis TaxID=643747 RepID=A0A840UHP0_9GAMM|nr:general secretion pathway protein GspB [Marinobacter oulmenensis]MBB5320666.1 general secretion pathway protein B [Marinobacter oulmenensis]